MLLKFCQLIQVNIEVRRCDMGIGILLTRRVTDNSYNAATKQRHSVLACITV